MFLKFSGFWKLLLINMQFCSSIAQSHCNYLELCQRAVCKLFQ